MTAPKSRPYPSTNSPALFAARSANIRRSSPPPTSSRSDALLLGRFPGAAQHEMMRGRPGFLDSPRARHAPAIDGCAFERTEHQPLGDKADKADHDQRRQHHVGIEEFLGVEDHPTETEIRARQHFGADH